MIITAKYNSPLGELLIGIHENELVICDWIHRANRNQIDQRICKALNSKYLMGEHPLIDQTIKELNQYFDKQLTQFSLSIKPIGTPFQKEVWRSLLFIPYGETTTYEAISISLNKQKAIRAVGTAIGANALSILISCHRIVGKNGQLTGYAGGIDAKRQLLSLEGSLFSSEQMSLFD